jgi:hypothetical protein
MWLSQYRLTRLARAFTGKSGPTRKTQPQRAPLCAEQLEDRTTPATLTPTTFADGVGIGSLRDAVLQANSNGQNNTIMLSAGNYLLSVAGRSESAGNTGDLNLTATGFTETIQGAGASASIVNASQIDRVFQIMPNVTVVLNNLTITGGLATDAGSVGGSDALGGGILNNGGNLTLNTVVVTGNTAQANTGHNARGGGIDSTGGSLTLSSSTITSNSALGGPGAPGSNGQTGTNGSNGGDAQGGGLYVSGGTLTITSSLIRNNVARGGNGGNGGNGNGVVPAHVHHVPFFTTGPFFTVGPFFTTGPAFTTGVIAPTVPVGFTGNSGGFTGGFTGGGATGGFTGGGATGGFSGGGASGGSGGGSSLRAAPLAGHGGMGGVGGRAQGGGLYAAGGTVHITGTTFNGNSVTGGAGGNGGNPFAAGGAGGASQGGGAFINSGTVDILDSKLTGNVANQAAPSLGTPGGDAPLGQGPNLFVGGGTVNTTGSDFVRKSSVGVVRPGPGGTGAVALDTDGSGIFNSTDPSFTFGLATDQFFAGDWTGNGADEIGVARADGNGSLLIVLDTNGNGQYDAGDQVFHFGMPGDHVIVGDWNGAGKSEIGVVRPDGHGGLLFALDTNGDGVFDAGDQVFDYGMAGDTVVVGDWTGNGKSKVGVARPNADGSLVWALDSNGDGVFDSGDAVYSYGAATDHPIVGDWSASGRTEIGVYRPDPLHNTQLFTLDANGNGVFDSADQIFTFGLPGDTVLVGKWKPPGQPLQAAGGPRRLSAPRPTLTAAELAPLVNEATDIWMATGLDAQQIEDLQHLTVQVGPLPGGVLGYRRGETLTLSPNAAGFGWFVDPTPADNAEFTLQTASGLRAARGSPAAGRMDLLTTVLHEEGHALGLPDLNPSVSMGDVMTESLSPGLRRLPHPGEAVP